MPKFSPIKFRNTRGKCGRRLIGNCPKCFARGPLGKSCIWECVENYKVFVLEKKCNAGHIAIDPLFIEDAFGDNRVGVKFDWYYTFPGVHQKIIRKGSIEEFIILEAATKTGESFLRLLNNDVAPRPTSYPLPETTGSCPRVANNVHTTTSASLSTLPLPPSPPSPSSEPSPPTHQSPPTPSPPPTPPITPRLLDLFYGSDNDEETPWARTDPTTRYAATYHATSEPTPRTQGQETVPTRSQLLPTPDIFLHFSSKTLYRNNHYMKG